MFKRDSSLGGTVGRQERWQRLLPLALLLLFTVQLVHVARLYSLNWDEAHHLYDGYTVWTRHDYRLNAEVPPLLKLAAALPLLPMHLQRPPEQPVGHPAQAFLEGRAFVVNNGVDRLVLPARLVCLLFALALGGAVFAVARTLFGYAAGAAALGLLVFDPLLLANGTLIATDVASALFLFASVFAFYRRAAPLDKPWLQPALLAGAGALAGFAMAAKFTGLLIAPILLTLAVAEGVRLRSMRELARQVLRAALILSIGWLVVWSFYGFRFAAAPHGQEPSPPLAAYLASTPNPADGAHLAVLARYHLLPEAYLWGLANTKKTEWEYTSYFFGRVYRHGPHAYFPAAFLIKSTLPLLLALAVLPLMWRRLGAERGRALLFLAVPSLLYFGVITASHFDIGARHLMPVYPFLYVLAGAACAAAWRAGSAWRGLACVLLLWQVGTSLHVSPAYMAYGNEAVGGPLQVRRYLSDANVDWGQQLRTVKQYLDRNGIHDCWFAYFPDGAVEPRDYGIPCRRLPTPSSLWWLKLPMDVPPVVSGTVLLSESVLDGVESGDGPLNPYDGFHALTPAAILQDGVYVYQGSFAIPLAAAWFAADQANARMVEGRMPEALALANHAVELAPNAARTQLTLADVEAKQNLWSGACQHYRLAAQWLEANRPELERESLGPGIQSGLSQCAAHAQGAAR